MASDSRVHEFLETAYRCLEEARSYFKGSNRSANFPLAITRSHECVELSLKAALLLAGRSNLPHTHDLSDNLIGIHKKFPEWFEKKVPAFALRSKVMSMISVYATYGYETTGTPPKDLFEEYDASMCIRNAEDIWNSCNRLFAEKETRHKP